MFFILIFAVFLQDIIFLHHSGQTRPRFIKILHVFDL